MPWELLGQTFEVVGHEKATITIEGSGPKSVFRAEGVGEGRGDAFKNPVTGEDHFAEVHLPQGFIWTRGECGQGAHHASAAGVEVAADNKNWVLYQFRLVKRVGRAGGPVPVSMLQHVLKAVDRQVQMHRAQEAALCMVENVAVEDPCAGAFAETHHQANGLLEGDVDGVLTLERPNRFPGLVEHEEKKPYRCTRWDHGVVFSSVQTCVSPIVASTGVALQKGTPLMPYSNDRSPGSCINVRSSSSCVAPSVLMGLMVRRTCGSGAPSYDGMSAMLIAIKSSISRSSVLP